MIENVVVQSSRFEPEDWILFEPESFQLVDARSLPELLVKCGIYKTTSEARRAGRDGPIPPGWTRMKASKKVPDFCIWNPQSWIADWPDND